jgi:hypothetical protein
MAVPPKGTLKHKSRALWPGSGDCGRLAVQRFAASALNFGVRYSALLSSEASWR